MTDYDIIVIGGGMAGLSCASYAARAGRKVAVIEELSCGGQIVSIDEIENYPAFGKIAGFSLAAKAQEQAELFGAEIIYDGVTDIKKNAEASFSVTTTSGTFECRAVVIATGSKHRLLSVPGEKALTGRGVSYCATCDGPFFAGKKILVCGGGDSACQEALFLKKISPDVTICHRRDRFRAQESLANRVKTSGIKLKMAQNVVSINEKNGMVGSVTFQTADGSLYDEDFDAVFIFVGFSPVSSLAKDCVKTESGFIVTDARMMTSVSGIFAAGDVRDTAFRQIVTAAADGAVAAHYASEYIDEADGNAY